MTWASLVNVTRTATASPRRAGCDGCFDAIAHVDAGDWCGRRGRRSSRSSIRRGCSIAGLSDGTGGPTDVDFGIGHGGASADVLENGAYRTDVPVVAGDVFRIAVSASGVVTYARNGQVFYTSSVTATAPPALRRGDGRAGASVERATFTGTTSPPTIGSPVTWETLVNTYASEGRLDQVQRLRRLLRRRRRLHRSARPRWRRATSSW